jgi:hypothetical protein
MGRVSGRRARASAAGLGAGGAILAACIIAEPPTNLPPPVFQRPTILRDRAVPPASRVLGTLPDAFIVDVVVDPTQGFEWRLFSDYDPLKGAERYSKQVVDPDPTATQGGSVRTISLAFSTEVPSGDQCHVIEGVVAYRFLGPNGTAVHAIDENAGGGDSIVWIYSPNGDVSGCPVFDAGIDGSDGAPE